jgi:hypothetical protein
MVAIRPPIAQRAENFGLAKNAIENGVSPCGAIHSDGERPSTGQMAEAWIGLSLVVMKVIWALDFLLVERSYSRCLM